MNIIDVLSELNIPHCKPGEHHHVRDGWVGVDCPYCPPSYGGKGKWKMGIEISSGRTNCWTCGGKNLIQVLSEISNSQYQSIKGLVSDIKFRRLIPTGIKSYGVLQKPKDVKPMEEVHREYLRNRNLNPESIERLWNVQGIGLSHQYKWRLFIPISLNGEEISWSTRSIGNVPNKYISASPSQERIHFKNSLYGIDLVRSTIVITEGPSDVWNIGPGAVCTYGLNYTPQQVSLMIRFPHRVVCFDNSVDAQRQASKLCVTLSMYQGRTTNVCLDAKDPGSADKREVTLLRDSFIT